MKSVLIPAFWLLLLAMPALADDEGIALCRRIAAELPPRPLYIAAQDAYPADPVSRGLQIAQAFGNASLPFELQPSKIVQKSERFGARPPERTYDWLLPKTVSGYHPSVRAFPDLDLNTVIYMSQNDLFWRGRTVDFAGPPERHFKTFDIRPHEGSRMIVNWTHGLTGMISNAGRVFAQLKLMNKAKPHGRMHEALKDLWFESTATAADMPFHGAGTFDPKYYTLQASLEWRLQYYQYLSKPGLPLVSSARSGETLFVTQLAYEHPELFKALILMGPMHPTAGFLESVQGYDAQTVKTGVDLNPYALKWFGEACGEMHQLPKEKKWWESERGVPPVPMLILVGGNDKEVSHATREHYKMLARKNPDLVFYVEVPGAQHDVMAVTESFVGKEQQWTAEAEARAIGAWRYVYWFLNTQVLHKEVAEPDLKWRYR